MFRSAFVIITIVGLVSGGRLYDECNRYRSKYLRPVPYPIPDYWADCLCSLGVRDCILAFFACKDYRKQNTAGCMISCHQVDDNGSQVGEGSIGFTLPTGSGCVSESNNQTGECQVSCMTG